ncbi:2OG-Fe(II) oxygenase [Cladochytrium replicatum]|nr:2OG-Fe(II) oxygenase [Cladochytrium replicatum]
MYEVPVIDLSGDPAVVAQQLYKACTTWGAFVATNHGIDESIMNRVVNESRKFFELPEEEKEKLHIRNGIAWRGYMPNGGEKTHGSTDNKEGLYVGPEHGPDHTRVKSSTPLYGPNQFPDAVLPNLRPAVLSYIEAGTGLGQRIMDLLSLSLGLSEDHIRAKFTPDPIALVRLFRYTPARSTSSFGDHSDYGLWTLLLHTQPGLQFYNEKLGVWGTVPAIPGSIVCNVGDVLDRMTGGRFISPRHRVLNLTGSTWLSIPFVFDPSWDAIMGPLPLDNLPELSEDDKTAAMARWDTTSIVSLEEPYSAFLAKKVSEGFHQDRASQ